MEKGECSVVFVSNYYNHHQQSLAEALYQRTGGRFYLIETSAIPPQRLKLGWGREEKPPYVIPCDQRAQALIQQAEVALIGSAPASILRRRIRTGKLTFRYTERPLKRGAQWWHYPRRWLSWRLAGYGKANVYALCASAYAAADYDRFGLYRGRCYRWGYFPPVGGDRQGDMGDRTENSLLWVGRLLPWKHPDAALRLARRLKTAGYPFQLTMIGTGQMEAQLQKMIQNWGLEDCVRLLGARPPEQVRHHMEQSQIFLFTSDRNEGWGAVLNEAMDAGCAVVASCAIGAVPFLMKDGENGLIYQDGDEEDLYSKVCRLLKNGDICREYGQKARQTTTQLWNGQVAADRLLTLTRALNAGEASPALYETGPCSPAPILRDNWYET